MGYFLFQRDRGILYFTAGIAVYLFFNILLYRFFNYYMYGNWIGLPGGDGYGYVKIAEDFVDKGYSLFYLNEYFESKQIMLDDYGMYSLASIIFYVLGRDWGYHLLPFVSIIPILAGGLLLKRMGLSLGIEKEHSYLLYFLWSTMTFACYDSSVALKENYMSFLVIASSYFLLQISFKPSFIKCFCFLFLASTLLFFRTAIFYMLIICFITALILRLDMFGKNFWLWLSFSIFTIVPMFPVVINYIGDVRGGVSIDFVNNVYDTKISEAGVFAPILNILAAFIGPIPSFLSGDEFKVKYMTLFSFSSTIKILISFGYLYTLYYAIRNKVLELIPIIMIIIFNSLMLIVLFYTLHDRYQWPQYPLVLLLAIYGFERYKKSNGKWFKYYCYLVILFIMIFNLRVV